MGGEEGGEGGGREEREGEREGGGRRGREGEGRGGLCEDGSHALEAIHGRFCNLS